MDWLTFIAAVIEAIAWPLAVVIIFLFLRKPIQELFPLLQRLRYRGLELDFGDQVQELAVRARAELPPDTGLSTTGGEFRQHLTALADLSPRAVVLESWLQLEQAAIDALRRREVRVTSQEVKSPILLGQALVDSGILNESKQTIFHRLRNLRNAAAHASDFAFDSDAALEYADLAVRLTDYLRQV